MPAMKVSYMRESELDSAWKAVPRDSAVNCGQSDIVPVQISEIPNPGFIPAEPNTFYDLKIQKNFPKASPEVITRYWILWTPVGEMPMEKLGEYVNILRDRWKFLRTSGAQIFPDQVERDFELAKIQEAYQFWLELMINQSREKK